MRVSPPLRTRLLTSSAHSEVARQADPTLDMGVVHAMLHELDNDESPANDALTRAPSSRREQLKERSAQLLFKNPR